MDEIKKIDIDQLTDIAAKQGFDRDLIIKDYYLTLILYLLRNVDGLYFKGGTALQKTMLGYARLSEDVDYTVVGDLGKIKSQIETLLKKSTVFTKVDKDKDVNGFTRLLIHYKVSDNKEDVIFIDLNTRAKLALASQKYPIVHFYREFIPEFSCNCLAKEEMVAEKVRATIQRNQTRDHFDVYSIIKKNLKIDFDLVKQKCKEAGVEFSIPRMFNNAQKLHTRWNDDLLPLLRDEIEFKIVIQTLANYFNLKKEKDTLKKQTM